MRQKPEEEAEVCWLWRETMRKMSCFGLFSNVTRNCMLIWRTYGFMGKENLIYRPGRASGERIIETPNAQLLKEMEFMIRYTNY